MKHPIMNWIKIFFFTTVCIHIGFSVMTIIASLAPDFSVFYESARSLKDNNNPYTSPALYTGFGYPPSTAFLYLPLTFFHYQFSQAVFVITSAILVFVIVSLCLKITKYEAQITTYLLLVSLVFMSFPTRFTLGMGQSNLLVYALLLGGFYYYLKGRIATSSILTALACLLKPLFIFLLSYYLVKKQWKLILFTTLIIFTVVYLTGLLYGFDLYWYYLTQIVPPLLNISGRDIYYNQGYIGAAARLLGDPNQIKIISTLLTLGTLVLLYKTVLTSKKEVLNFSFFLITLTLIDSLSWQHHFVFLILPFVAVVLNKHTGKTALSLLVVSYMLISWNIKNPQSVTTLRNIVLSHVTLGTIILWCILYGLISNSHTFGKVRGKRRF